MKNAAACYYFAKGSEPNQSNRRNHHIMHDDRDYTHGYPIILPFLRVVWLLTKRLQNNLT